MSTGSDQQQQTVYITTTSVVSNPSPTSSGDANSLSAVGKGSKGKSGLSGGAIAGIVIGVIAGVAILAMLLVFLLWRRHKSNQEPDLEETKQYQPYSFGDADANPIILPPSRSTSNWRKPSRTDLGSNENNSVAVPNGALGANNSISRSSNKSNNMFASDDQNAIALQSHPSTVFEEPPSLYGGNQRFSTGSLPDMMQERQLRVVNPDDSRSRLDEITNEDRDLDYDDDDFKDDILLSTGSSRGSMTEQ